MLDVELQPINNEAHCSHRDTNVLNLKFSKIVYEVPDIINGEWKTILKHVSGEFRGRQLTAIMGSTGSGKTALLNMLSGYRLNQTSSRIHINDKPRDMKWFRRFSRYIMQNDDVNPYFTVMEAMFLAYHLKMGIKYGRAEELKTVLEILTTLGLENVKESKISSLSGGERKRVCIALELLDNPLIIFLDEPTTGLDEHAAFQCVSLLKRLVLRGCTIICSIHSPSARIYEMFDHAYILTEGQCIYQGCTKEMVPYLKRIGLDCPVSYNPADYVMEVVQGDYGDYHSALVQHSANGQNSSNSSEAMDQQCGPCGLNFSILSARREASWCLQYRLLFLRMFLQMWRNKFHLRLKLYVYIFLAVILASVYSEIGVNAKVFAYNFHFSYIMIVAYLFISMTPMLSMVPNEMCYLRREYFNQWYSLGAHFMALITVPLPDLLLLSAGFSAICYLSTHQPLEWLRFILFIVISIMTSLTAMSYGIMIGSRFSIKNALFIGPAFIAPSIMLASYTVGNPNMSYFVYALVKVNFIRQALEAFITCLLDLQRSSPQCPAHMMFCIFGKPRFLLRIWGFENTNYFINLISLLAFYIIFTLASYLIIKQRVSVQLNNKKSSIYVKYMLRHYFKMS